MKTRFVPPRIRDRWATPYGHARRTRARHTRPTQRPSGARPSLEALGWLYYKKGKADQAEPLLERSLAMFEKALGADHPHVARCCAKMGMACSAQGQHDKAESWCKRAVSICEKTGDAPTNLAKVLDEYAAVLRKANRTAEAEKLEARARSIREARR